MERRVRWKSHARCEGGENEVTAGKAGELVTYSYTAEKQVTDVVKCDIHLDYTPDGKRYIDRISEIIQLEEGIPYPEYDAKNPVDSMNEITKEYKGKNVLVATHAGICLYVRCYFEGEPDGVLYEKYKLGNCEFLSYEN